MLVVLTLPRCVCESLRAAHASRCRSNSLLNALRIARNSISCTSLKRRSCVECTACIAATSFSISSSVVISFLGSFEFAAQHRAASSRVRVVGGEEGQSDGAACCSFFRFSTQVEGLPNSREEHRSVFTSTRHGVDRNQQTMRVRQTKNILCLPYVFGCSQTWYRWTACEKVRSREKQRKLLVPCSYLIRC